MEILFKTGQEFERMALGELNKEKQKEAKEPYVRALAIDRVFSHIKDEEVRRAFADEKLKRDLEDGKTEMIDKVEKEIKLIWEQENLYNWHSEVLDQDTARIIVEKSQPERRQGLADDLYNTVANNLELDLDAVDENEDYIDLKYYTAVGSKLDYIWGIDCFMVYTYLDEKTNEKKEITITIDITINTEKFDSKADLTLFFEKEDIAKKGAWKGSVNKNGKMIADKIKEKIANSK